MTARDRMTTFEDAGLWMQYWARNEKQRPQSATLSGKHSASAIKHLTSLETKTQVRGTGRPDRSDQI